MHSQGILCKLCPQLSDTSCQQHLICLGAYQMSIQKTLLCIFNQYLIIRNHLDLIGILWTSSILASLWDLKEEANSPIWLLSGHSISPWPGRSWVWFLSRALISAAGSIANPGQCVCRQSQSMCLFHVDVSLSLSLQHPSILSKIRKTYSQVRINNNNKKMQAKYSLWSREFGMSSKALMFTFLSSICCFLFLYNRFTVSSYKFCSFEKYLISIIWHFYEMSFYLDFFFSFHLSTFKAKVI